MHELTTKERELVALGAAIACNCVPCIEHHAPEARKAGLTASQIRQAVRLADHVRRVPAGRVLRVALELLGDGEAALAATECTGAASPGPEQGPSSACCG